MTDKPNLPFGASAVQLGYATPEQVEHALELQRQRRSRGKKHAMLGVLMTELGFITREQLLKILQHAEGQEFKMAEDAIPLAVRIRTAAGEDKRAILFTGAVESEGVSTIAYQIALAMAVMDEGRVLLVDANYRSPTVNAYVQAQVKKQGNGERPVRGLSELIEKTASPADVVCATATPNLSILGTGNPAVDFLSLLLREEYGQLLDQLRKDYRYILIDTPPILKYPDASMIAPRTDGAVVVLTQGERSKGEVHEIRRAFDALRVPMLGVVLYDRSKR